MRKIGTGCDANAPRSFLTTYELKMRMILKICGKCASSGLKRRHSRLLNCLKRGEERGPQISTGEGLLKHRAECPPRINTSCAVTACKDERDAALDQRLHQLRDAFTRYVDVQNRNIDTAGLQAPHCLRHPACREGDFAAKIEKKLLDQHRNKGLILDDENSQTIEGINSSVHGSSPGMSLCTCAE